MLPSAGHNKLTHSSPRSPPALPEHIHVCRWPEARLSKGTAILLLPINRENLRLVGSAPIGRCLAALTKATKRMQTATTLAGPRSGPTTRNAPRGAEVEDRHRFAVQRQGLTQLWLSSPGHKGGTATHEVLPSPGHTCESRLLNNHTCWGPPARATTKQPLGVVPGGRTHHRTCPAAARATSMHAAKHSRLCRKGVPLHTKVHTRRPTAHRLHHHSQAATLQRGFEPRAHGK
jgi:hypothetical protein